MWNNQGGGFDGGGGGFQSPGGFGTPQQSQEKKGARSRAQNILPCTVAQVFNATQNEDKFFTGDTEMLQITIVGLVRTVKETQTRIDYEVDDMTGPPIEVKQFVDNDDSVPEDERVSTMRENTYVRVSGHVRSFGGKRSIVAYKMVPVLDMNELSCHMLEIIHSHLVLSSSPSTMSATGDAGGNMSMNYGSYNNNDAGGGGIIGLTPIQNQIHLLIKNNPSESGANVSSVCQNLKGIPMKAVKDAIDFLSSEGHIYSTIDEDHYKATDG